MLHLGEHHQQVAAVGQIFEDLLLMAALLAAVAAVLFLEQLLDDAGGVAGGQQAGEGESGVVAGGPGGVLEFDDAPLDGIAPGLELAQLIGAAALQHAVLELLPGFFEMLAGGFEVAHGAFLGAQSAAILLEGLFLLLLAQGQQRLKGEFEGFHDAIVQELG